MFVSDKLVFTELHKTGGTHICKWLNKLVGGEQIGKHNRIPAHLWDRFVLGSVRNPWEWYVSLWAYGCAQKGSVYQQTTRRINLNYLNRELHGEMGLRRLAPFIWARQILKDLLKPVTTWQNVYQDYTDFNAFRKWLRLMLDPNRRFDMGEGYGFSPVSHRFGLMTYRFMKFFTSLGTELYKDSTLSDLSGIGQVWANRRLVRFVIRNETLEQDFITGLRSAGYVLAKRDITALIEARDRKTNTSQRLSALQYYDKRSIDLVAQREAFIITEYNYAPPNE